MDFGVNRKPRLTRGRALALMFFLGMFIGVFIGHWLGSDGRQTTVDDVAPEQTTGP